MLEWTPHLATLFGDSDRARIQISQTLTLANALRESRLRIAERLRVIAMVGELDSMRQVLLAPALMESVISPSRAVRRQVLALAEQLVADKERPLREALKAVFGRRRPEESTNIRTLLDRLAESITELTDEDLNAPFEELLRVRPHVFVLSTLFAVTRWVRNSDDARIRVEFESRLSSNEELIDHLGNWLEKGNLLLRYLLVMWMAEAEESLIADQPTTRLALQQMYSTDDDAVVAGASVEHYAALADANEIESTIEFLTHELETLESRRVRFSGMSARKATAQITSSLITALGTIGRNHVESDTAMDALLRVVETPPRDRLNLARNLGQKDVPGRFTREQNLEIFRAAMHLRGAEILVRVLLRRDHRSGLAGFNEPITLVDPHGVLRDNPDCRFCWVRAKANDDPDPLKWHYAIVEAAEKRTPEASDLLPLISPLLMATSRKRRPDPSKHNFWLNIAGRELDEREPWIRAGWNAAATVLARAIERQLDLQANEYPRIVQYLADMAIGINRIPYGQVMQIPVRKRVKDLVRRSLFSELARFEVIGLLCSSGTSMPTLEAQFVSDMASTALGSFPGDPTQTWLFGNLQRLHAITEMQLHMRIRGPASAIMYLHRSNPKLQREFGRLSIPDLPADNTFLEFGAALMCVSHVGLVQQFEKHIGSWNNAGDVVNGSDAHHRNRCRRLVEECLARELATDPESSAAEHAAAACLCWQDEQQQMPPISRLRLLQAYARSDVTPERSVRRLLDHLLRTANSVELGFYLDAAAQAAEERADYEPQFDDALVRRLVRFLHETEHGDLLTWHQHEINMHALRDQLQRRPTILRELARQARQFGDRFENEYRKVREEQTRILNRVGLVSASGVVLSGNEDTQRIYSVLKPDDVAGETIDVTELGCDRVTAFTWHPRFSSEVRCLTRFTPAPADALDFHSLSLDSNEKTSLLIRKLAETDDPLMLCARVAKPVGKSGLLVDLGVTAPSLSTRHVIDADLADGHSPNLVADDVVLVELISFPGVNLYASKIWLELHEPSIGGNAKVESGRSEIASGGKRTARQALKTYDLRESQPQDALARLEYLNDRWQREGRKFGLWATVDNVVEDRKNTERVRWYLDCGFRWRGRNSKVQPSVIVSRGRDIPAEPFIVVPQSRYSIQIEREQVTDRDCVTYRVLPADMRRVKLVRPVSGRLQSRQNSYGRREWYGVISGGARYLVNRSDLTADLQTLFALDDIPDDHPTLQRLQTEDVQFLAVGTGKTLSVLDAPPTRNRDDLLIVVQAGQVEYITYIGRAEGDQLIFEVTRCGGVGGEQKGALPLLGFLVTVAEDSLFDHQGSPVDARNWSKGDRVIVSAQFGILQPDGMFVRHDEGTVGTWPQLQMIGERQNLYRGCVEALQAGAPITVRLLEKEPKVRLEVVEGCLSEPLPLPSVRIGTDNWTFKTLRKYRVGTEIDVVVAEELEPDSATYEVSVRTHFSLEIQLARGREAADAASLINLAVGDVIHWPPRIKRTRGAFGLSTKGHLWVNPDPLLAWLLPKMPDELKPGTLDRTGIRVSSVHAWKSNRAWIIDPDGLPDIEDLGESGELLGLVTSVPPRKRETEEAQSNQVGVRWIGVDDRGQADEMARLSDRWSFDPGSFKWKSQRENWQPRLGDVIRVQRTNGKIRFEYQPRSIKGSFLHRPISWEEWIQSVRDKDHWGLLLRKAENGTPWLFSFAPGYLVEIPTSSLLGVNRLDEAWQLDRVRIHIERSNSGTTFEVTRLDYGVLHAAVGQKLKLTVQSRRRANQSLRSTLNHHSFGGKVLSLDLRERELPPGFDGEKLTSQERVTEDGPCTLTNYSLELVENLDDEIADDGVEEHSLSFSIRVDLDQFVVEQKTVSKGQKVRRSLAQELQLCEGRIDIPKTSLVRRGDDYELQLSNYDPFRVPVPDDELTWIPMIDVSLSSKWSGAATIVKSDTGVIVGSLRRNRPQTLETWLKEIGRTRPGQLVDDKPFMYYGELKEQYLQQLGLDRPETPEDDENQDEVHREQDAQQKVLLELEPGRTLMASVSQVLFLGEPLQLGGKARGDSGLHTGDTIAEFKVEENTNDGSLRINILGSVPDIRYQVENFDHRKGILFGKVSLGADGTVHLDNFYGADWSGQKPHKTGRWIPRVVEPTEEVLGIVGDLRPGEYAYLKFDHADAAEGILWFRILTPGEAFTEKNLVYVKPLEVTPYGDSRKLQVRPLAQIEEGDYFISETQYSKRRGALRGYQSSDLAPICMASVYSRGEYREKPSTTLSLTQNPSRRFSYLMAHSDWRGSVSRTSLHDFTIELSPGTNADIPFDNVHIDKDDRERLQSGAIAILSSERREWKVHVRNVIPSQLEYLPAKSHPKFFAELWSRKVEQRRKWFNKGSLDLGRIGKPSDRYRELKHQFDRYQSHLVLEGRVKGLLQQGNTTIAFIDIGIGVPKPDGKFGDPVHFLQSGDPPLNENDDVRVRVLGVDFDNDSRLSSFDYLVELESDRRGDVPCSIVGFPQLSGQGRIRESDLNSYGPIPLAFKGLTSNREWVELEDSSDLGWAAGKLHSCEDGMELCTSDNDRLQITWSHVSYFFGTLTECQRRLSKWNWWNSKAADKKDRPETIGRSYVIARRTKDSASLTAFAELPCPVDHLVEQYPPGSTSRQFIVARSERERLILEVAPGRYAELPTVLLEPLHGDGRLREGLTLNWESLLAGDEVDLTIVSAERSRDADILPNFRITRVTPSRWHLLRMPLVTVHTSAPDGHRVLGLPGQDEIPADILPLPLEERPIDLGRIEKPFERYRELKHQFDRYKSHLVLKGRVKGLLQQGNTTIAFIDIGIGVPKPDGKFGDPAHFLKSGDPPLNENDDVRVRVLGMDLDNGFRLLSFDYTVERELGKASRLLVRVLNGRLSTQVGFPQQGDSVFVHCPDSEDQVTVRVVGFESYSVTWVDDGRDSLNLHDPSQRELIFGRLLDNPSRMLAATVEEANEFNRTVTLSRRNQLDSVYLESGQVGRGRIRFVLRQNRMLIEVLGVPVIMRTEDFCHGAPWLKFFADEIEKADQGCGIETEFVWLDHGGVSCSNLYQPLASLPGEFDSRIELVAESGLTAIASGNRYFVPKSELAWFQLDGLLLKKLFRRQGRLPLRATEMPQSGVVGTTIRTSHTGIHDIRSQIAHMIHDRREPVYVTVVAIDSSGSRAVVRGQSGVLMELPLQTQGAFSEKDRLPAYVSNIDTTNRIVVLSQEDRPLELLSLPDISDDYAIDQLTTELIKARLENLRTAINSAKADNIVDWLQGQSCLEPGPRTVRCVLETVHKAGLGTIDWWQEHLAHTSGNSTFLDLWRDFSKLLAGSDMQAMDNPGARFAMGYRCLMDTDEVEEAARWLEPLKDHPTWAKYFDVHLCLARIDRLRGDDIGMTNRMRAILPRLFNNALRSILPPLAAPHSKPELARELSNALASGQLTEIQRLAESEQQRMPGSPYVLSLHIWHEMAREQRDEDAISNIFDRFLYNAEAEREASRLHSDFDPRWFLWAAWSCFARGRIADGWQYFEKMDALVTQGVDAPDETMELARAWYAWLASHPLPEGTGRLYVLLFELFGGCRWRVRCDRRLFDEFWSLFTKSLQRWPLNIPVCQSVSSPKTDSSESLSEWCELNNCRDLYQSLTIELNMPND